jgi:hypothetical protein
MLLSRTRPTITWSIHQARPNQARVKVVKAIQAMPLVRGFSRARRMNNVSNMIHVAFTNRSPRDGVMMEEA